MEESQILQEACAAPVEKILEPLVEQISMLTDRNDSLERPKGLSQNKATVLDLVKNVSRQLLYLTKFKSALGKPLSFETILDLYCRELHNWENAFII